MSAALEIDVTGWLIARLAAPGVTVDSRTPDDLQAHLPFIRPVRVGGPDDGYVLDIPTMVFHCFAATDAAANALAYTVAGELRNLIGVVADGAVITKVRKLGGPAWNYSANPAVSEALLTMQLRMKTA